jgi:SAM-dependent methyltransferase
MIKIIKKIALVILKNISYLSFFKKHHEKLNLCSGNQVVEGYTSLDYNFYADLTVNLNRGKLPFKSDSLSVVVCTSAINYFTRSRGQEIINEVYRILKTGGVARFSSQDLEFIANKYVNKDTKFFFQKLSNGKERFEGKTMGDKFNSWFYGYDSHAGGCKYFYDFETLSDLFSSAGFKIIEQKNYLDSRLYNIDMIDNRKNQMFFLEAVK